MDIEYRQEIAKTVSTGKLIVFSVIACICMAVTGFISSLLMAESEIVTRYSGYALSATESTVYIIATAIGLPLAALATSQLLIEYRGLINGVKAVFYASIVTLLAQVPVLFALMDQAAR